MSSMTATAVHCSFQESTHRKYFPFLNCFIFVILLLNEKYSLWFHLLNNTKKAFLPRLLLKLYEST